MVQQVKLRPAMTTSYVAICGVSQKMEDGSLTFSSSAWEAVVMAQVV